MTHSLRLWHGLLLSPGVTQCWLTCEGRGAARGAHGREGQSRSGQLRPE